MVDAGPPDREPLKPSDWTTLGDDKLLEYLDWNKASDYNRLVKLGDLKIAGAIGIKIGFSVEFAEERNIRSNRKAELNRFSHSFLVQNRQCSWQTETNMTHQSVWWRLTGVISNRRK